MLDAVCAPAVRIGFGGVGGSGNRKPMFHLLSTGAFPAAACPRVGSDWSSSPVWPTAACPWEAEPSRREAAYRPPSAAEHQEEAARRLEAERLPHPSVAWEAAAVAAAAGIADRVVPG